MVLLLAACGLASRPTPTLPDTQMAPLPIHWTQGAADMFVAIDRSPPDGAIEGTIWWHGPDGEKPPGATDRLGPPIGVATLLREDFAEWNLLEIDGTALRLSGHDRSLTLSEGRIAEDDKRGELVRDLYDTLLERHEGSREFEARTGLDLPPWRLGFRATPDVPWATIREVLYTGAQAMYGTQCFVGSGTYEALEQRCFELEPLRSPVHEPPVYNAQIIVSPDGARLDGDATGDLDGDGSAVKGAKLVLVRVQDEDVPAGRVAHWLGVLAKAGVGGVHVRLATDAESATETPAPEGEPSKLLEKLLR